MLRRERVGVGMKRGAGLDSWLGRGELKTAPLMARFCSISEEAFFIGPYEAVGETAGVAGSGGFF